MLSKKPDSTEMPITTMLACRHVAVELLPGLVDPKPRKFCPPRPFVVANTDGSIVTVLMVYQGLNQKARVYSIAYKLTAVAMVVAKVCVVVG